MNGKLAFPGFDARPICHKMLRSHAPADARLSAHLSLWLIDQGFGPKRVQYLMGYSGIQVTFDTCGHLFPAVDNHERFARAELAWVG